MFSYLNLEMLLRNMHGWIQPAKHDRDRMHCLYYKDLCLVYMHVHIHACTHTMLQINYLLTEIQIISNLLGMREKNDLIKQIAAILGQVHVHRIFI